MREAEEVEAARFAVVLLGFHHLQIHGSPVSAVLCGCSDFRHRVPTPFVASDAGTRCRDGDGSPRFLSGPHAHVPCSMTPAGRCTPGPITSCSVLPSAPNTASAPTMSLFSGLNHTARVLPVYASQIALPHSTQHSVPAAGLLYRVRSSHWATMKSFCRAAAARAPPFSSLPGAHSAQTEFAVLRAGRAARARRATTAAPSAEWRRREIM